MIINSYHAATAETNYLDELSTAFAFMLAKLETLTGNIEVTEHVPIHLQKAIESRQCVTSCLEAFVYYFEPQDKLWLYRKRSYLGHIEALSILKSLIILDEDESHHSSFHFLFHPHLLYSLPNILADENIVSPGAIRLFFNNKRFRALLDEAANHMIGIKTAFREILNMMKAEVDPATNSIVYRSNITDQFPAGTRSLLRIDGRPTDCTSVNCDCWYDQCCNCAWIAAPYHSSGTNPSSLLVVLNGKDPPRNKWEWIKFFKLKYPDVPTVGRTNLAPATALRGPRPQQMKDPAEERPPFEASIVASHKAAGYHDTDDEDDQKEGVWKNREDSDWIWRAELLKSGDDEENSKSNKDEEKSTSSMSMSSLSSLSQDEYEEKPTSPKSDEDDGKSLSSMSSMKSQDWWSFSDEAPAEADDEA